MFNMPPTRPIPEIGQLFPVQAAPVPIFRVGTKSSIINLDPCESWDSGSIDVINQVCEGLFAYNLSDPELSVEPRLATTLGMWNIERTELTIPLRTDVLFHDGTEFNATSAKWNLDRLNFFVEMDQTPFAYMYRPLADQYPDTPLLINQTEILSPYTIKIVLNYPCVPIMALLCFSGATMLSPSVTPATEFLSVSNDDPLVGTGPFKLISYNDTVIQFEAFTDYYRGMAEIQTMEFHILDSYLQSTELSIGNLDFILSVNSGFKPLFEADPDIILLDSIKSPVIFYIGMNNQVINQTLREAISYTFDYDNFLSWFGSGGSRLTSYIPEGLLFHYEEGNLPTHNISHARQILLDAGIVPEIAQSWTDEQWISIAESTAPLFSFNYTYNEGTNARGEAGNNLKYNLRFLGIHLDLIPMDWIPYIDLLNDHPEQVELFMIGWGPDYNDPTTYINVLFSNSSSANFAQINDPYLEILLEEGWTETDIEARRDIYYQIQDYLLSELHPWLLIYQKTYSLAHTYQLGEYPVNNLNYVSFYECRWPFVDTDRDRIGDDDEINIYGTDPNDADSDDDALTDYEEIFEYETDPLDPDCDDDGCFDGLEIEYGTDPYNPDTDGDGMSDFDEIVIYFLDPCNPDTDGDGLDDFFETYTSGTDATEVDTDGDGLDDYYEIYTSGTNAMEADTDGDGLDDYYEIYTSGTNAMEADTDGDGLDDYFEIYTSGTDATDIDTDDDGFNDKEEWDAGTDPFDPLDYPGATPPDDDDDGDDSSPTGFEPLGIPGYTQGYLGSATVLALLGLVLWNIRKKFWKE
jgi:ABC-type transport system substrate-binding protein